MMIQFITLWLFSVLCAMVLVWYNAVQELRPGYDRTPAWLMGYCFTEYYFVTTGITCCGVILELVKG